MKAERKQKIAVFGGSFDPPHYGHYDIVKNLERAFDRVIVVPSYISPFKTNGGEDAKVRLGLCKKLFTSDKTEVCSREINKKGVSYSVDTAAYFAKKYKDAALYWVIGSEEVKRLSDWHDLDRLKTLVTFLVVPRPGYAADESDVKALKKRKVKLKTAKFDGLDISSTAVKIDTAFKKPNSAVPDIVRKTAAAKGLFDPYSKYVAALYAYGLSEKRINHIYGTTVRGAELAKLYGGSVHDAVVACILHDIAKEKDGSEYAGAVDTDGYPEPTVHAPIGAYIAKKEFGVSDEIARAIRVHATADGNMTLLDEIVYLADKSEMNRSYKEVFELRRLCAEDKDKAMAYILPKVADYREDAVPCRMTEAAVALYAARLKEKSAAEKGAEKDKEKTDGAKSGALPVLRGGRELSEIKSKSVAVFNKPEKSLAVKPVGEMVPVADKEKNAVKEIAFTVAAELSLHKAHDIDIIDLGGKTIIADYFVIASASSTTAVKALMGYTEDILTKKYGLDPIRRDVDGEWVALDYGGVIVHIFTDRTREFYNIERLWADGKNVTRFDD